MWKNTLANDLIYQFFCDISKMCAELFVVSNKCRGFSNSLVYP